MNETTKFQAEVENNIQNLQDDPDVQALSRIWLREITPYKYAYNFTWMGRPIIQFPQDMLAMQEIIWNLKPDLIIETGIAHGGSLIFHASMLELVGEDADVLGIDIDIREHNRSEIEKHPMFKRITLIEGSSIDDKTVQKVFDFAKNKQRVLIILDSNHTHEHVLNELKIYSRLVTKDSYLIVFDTLVEDMPDSLSGDRPWGKGNNPKTAVWEFLKNNDRFEIDKKIESKLLITVAPDGYLKCIKD
ncbi:cephalosporin hydroxylase family protein [Chamaesiphon minutus]|uniref:Cephalosporin hydroxylase n=1 Tax=Chamaesiphon minutus (strain ATCC 27169 / PCC 6605) TaxID=1173020 RepID=K9UJ28_CHAP6|nr:cephalosporin hydroxylase family protein [Chamaesiphon minutus]AFY94668.1 cephalosporin hydroxylase [Chamaesiphon minutus PCC 6605]